MSCNRFHYEMSLGLDGRLPSGRREGLMSHLAECATCASLWEEMQCAQELAATLPPESVSNSFSDTLWQRIRSGEGTPEAVYLQPLPTWRKIRYVMSGAAAAAVLLFGVQLLSGGAGVDDTPRVIGEVADATGPRGDDATAFVPSSVQSVFDVQPIDPPSVAQASAETVVDTMHSLQNAIRLLARDGGETSVRVARNRLLDSAERLRGSTDTILWLQQKQFIELPGNWKTELERAQRFVELLERARENREVRLAVEEFRGIDVAGLYEQFNVRCCDYGDFPTEFQLHVARNPHASKFLQIQLIEPGPGMSKPSALVIVRRRGLQYRFADPEPPEGSGGEGDERNEGR